MVVLDRIATALPQNGYTREQLAVSAEQWLGGDKRALELYNRLAASANVEKRFFAVNIAKLLTLSGLAERSKIFSEVGLELAGEVCDRLFAESPAKEIATLVSSSCSVPIIPALDAQLIHRQGFSPGVHRIPIFQQGCAGGVAGLALGRKLVAPNKPVMVLSVELSSLVFQFGNRSGANLVGSAIFGDGAAAAVLREGDRGWVIEAAGSYLIPESTNLMGYDLMDDGLHLRLSRELPQAVATHLPKVIEQFLAEQDLKTTDIPFWLFHPGGVKVLRSLEQAINLKTEQTRWAWEVLKSVGNMSSATILFVIDRFLKSGEYRNGDRALIVGIGPGLTLEAILMQYRG